MDYLLEIVYLCTIFLLLYITAVNNSGTIQLFLIIEHIVFTKTSDFFKALWGLKTAYFTFNIQYPKAFTNVLVFIQHLLWGIKDKGQKISPLLNQVYMII